MTTAGSNGAPEDPADDDPFAYLYRPADGEAAAAQPRNSYARPMEVGRAQYGQQPAQAQPYRPQPQAPQATTQLPQQQTRYAEHSRPQPGEERPSRGRGKAAVIGAVAVVAAIAIGAGVALSGGDPGKDKVAVPPPHSSAPATTGSSAPTSASALPTASTDPVADASKLQAQGAPSGNSIKGAISADGSYLTLQAGSTVSWTISVPTAGTYKFWLHYDNTGADVPAVVLVNGKERDGGVVLQNYNKGNTDPTQGWVATNIWPELQAGPNTLTVSLPAGSSGSIPLDQVAITAKAVTKYPRN